MTTVTRFPLATREDVVPGPSFAKMVRRREPIDWVPYDGDRVAAVRPSVRVLQSVLVSVRRSCFAVFVHAVIGCARLW